MQEGEEQDKQEHKYPWKKVERRKQTDKKKTPIIICGDSMVKEINKNISMKEERSELCCMRGANIREIMENVKEKCKDVGPHWIYWHKLLFMQCTVKDKIISELTQECTFIN